MEGMYRKLKYHNRNWISFWDCVCRCDL